MMAKSATACILPDLTLSGLGDAPNEMVRLKGKIMNNMLHIVIIVLAIQAVALCVAMALGRAAKSGDRFEGPDEFDDARAAKATLRVRSKAARVAQPAQMQQSSH